jgi:hypothetical protein
MRAFFALFCAALVLAGLAAALTLEPELVHARVRVRRKGSTHCGCVNKDSCTEPCSAGCGPNGYADCFKNPSPTSCAPVTSTR